MLTSSDHLSTPIWARFSRNLYANCKTKLILAMKHTPNRPQRTRSVTEDQVESAPHQGKDMELSSIVRGTTNRRSYLPQSINTPVLVDPEYARKIQNIWLDLQKYFLEEEKEYNRFSLPIRQTMPNGEITEIDCNTCSLTNYTYLSIAIYDLIF